MKSLPPKNTVALALVAALSVAIVGCSQAADEPPPQVGGSQQAISAACAGNQTPGERLFQRWDTDGDGRITLSTLPQHAQDRVKVADTNNDGLITREELLAAREKGLLQRGGMGRGMKSGRGPGSFLQWDKDGDGKVALSDLPQPAQERFKVADTNNDGFVTHEEVIAAHQNGSLTPGRMGKGAPGRGGRGQQMFQKWDKDGDGKVALSDIPQPVQTRFEVADSNKDGFLTREELQAARNSGALRPRGMQGGGMRGPNGQGMFARWDTDGDGKIALSTLPPPAQARFKVADTDHDGYITRDEANVARAQFRAQRFQQSDTNHDGTLTSEEVGPQRWNRLAKADANRDGKVTREEIEAAFKNGTLQPFGGRGGPGAGARSKVK